MMSLELSEKIQIDTSVILAVKPTHVTFAKNFQGYISITNQFRARIKGINNGKLLSSAIFETKNTLIESVFTTTSLRQMNLQLHDEFTVMIKASDISIKEICDD
jgi:molybdopterin-binding protein